MWYAVKVGGKKNKRKIKVKVEIKKVRFIDALKIDLYGNRLHGICS